MRKRAVRVVGGALISLAMLGFAPAAMAQEAGGALGLRLGGPIDLGVQADAYARGQADRGLYDDAPEPYGRYAEAPRYDRRYEQRGYERRPLVGGIVDGALGLAGRTTGAALDTAAVATDGALGLADGIVGSVLGSPR